MEEGLGCIRITAWKMTVVVMMTMMMRVTRGDLHYVGGGKYNWLPNTNFTEWSSTQQFHVGDWLYFGYDKNIYNVLEVNESSYEKCIESDFIKNVTKGGRDVFELTMAKPYFFISGRGFCYQGMKLAVNVTQLNQTTDAPLPSPNRSGSSTSHDRSHMPLLILSICAFLMLLFHV